jgi:hypothetical protein
VAGRFVAGRFVGGRFVGVPYFSLDCPFNMKRIYKDKFIVNTPCK